MASPTKPPVWTDAREAQLVRLWGSFTPTRIAAIMGLTYARVTWKARDLGLPKRSLKTCYEPLRSDWIDIASRRADEAGVSSTEVLAGVMRRDVVRARWLAWREILDQWPHLSIAGVSRISGFDHTTILHGLRRLDGATPSDVRKARAIGRQPVMQEAA